MDNTVGVQRYNQNMGEYEYYVALTESRIKDNPLTERSGFLLLLLLFQI